MKLSAGIVGLPNVGKSTLFNAITNLNVEAANYPFATIEPNVGIVKLNDERLTKLTNLIKPKKTTYATCTFVDIAGLVKGASNGEGLGNKFLSNIREVDAICHVVRCFNDSGITHVFNTVDPIRDAEIINLELIYSDLDILEKRLSKIAQTAKSGNTLAAFEESILKRLINSLKESNFINTNNFSVEENKIITNYNLITAKPFLYIANLNDDDISSPEANNNFKLFSE
jgi:GTP-binding protein YchF